MRPHAFGSESGDLAPVCWRFPPNVPMPVHGEVLALAFPRPDFLLSIEEGGLLKSWKCMSGGDWCSTGVRELEEFAASWCLNEPGTLAVGASGEEISCWNTEDGELIWSVSAPDWVTAISIDDASGRVATGHDDGRVMLWDLSTGKWLREIGNGAGGISSISLCLGGGLVAAADESCQIVVWRLGDQTVPPVRLSGHKGRVVSLAWNRRDGHLLSAAWDTTVRVWNVDEGRPIMLINDHDGQVMAMVVAPDGQSVATFDSGAYMRVWCLRNWSRLSGPSPLPFEVKQASFAPDGSLAIGLERSQLKVLRDVISPEIGSLDPANPDAVRPVLALEKDSSLIALGPDGKLRSWSLESSSGAPASFQVDGHPGRFKAVAIHGGYMLGLESPGRGGSMSGLFRLQKGGNSAVRVATLEGLALPSTCLAIHASAGFAALASPLGPELWIRSLPDGRPHLLISDPLTGGSIQQLAFSPDGKMLAIVGIEAAGRSGQILVVDPESGQEYLRLSLGAWRIAWHPTGDRMALLDQEGRVVVARIDGEVVGRARGADSLRTIAFSADGSWLLAAGEDRVLRVWPSGGGVPVAAMDLTGQPAAMHAMPDPGRFAVLFADGGVWIIDLPTLLEGHCD